MPGTASVSDPLCAGKKLLSLVSRCDASGRENLACELTGFLRPGGRRACPDRLRLKAAAHVPSMFSTPGFSRRLVLRRVLNAQVGTTLA